MKDSIIDKLIHVALFSPREDTYVACDTRVAYAHGVRCLVIIDSSTNHIILYKGYNDNATMYQRVYAVIEESHVTINRDTLSQLKRNGHVLDVWGCRWTVDISTEECDMTVHGTYGTRANKLRA